MISEVQTPFQFFFDNDGMPLEDGYIYIGTQNLNPETNPIVVYWDEGLTIPAAQPIRTLNGYPSRIGTPARLFVNANRHSITVKNKNGVLMYSDLNTSILQEAAQITGGQQVVDTIADLRALDKNSPSKSAFVNGYYASGDGGGGNYYLDPSDTVSADNGGTIIVATDGGRWKLARSLSVTIKQFGAIAGVFDGATQLINDDAFQRARDWIAAGATQNHLVFQEGIYGYSVSPNWGIQDAVITAQGEVRLRYFGTGNAVILDTGPTLNTFTYNVTMKRFIVECPGTALNGVFIRSIHSSDLGFNVKGAGPTSNGILVSFAVCTRFDNCKVSAHEDGAWYLGAQPLNGIRLLERNVGEQVSYCTFINTVLEDMNTVGGAGLLLEGTLGNVFIGGTSEENYYGILTGTGSIQNRIYGMDMELNSQDDIYDQGQGNEFHGVDCQTHITVAGEALFPKFFGGNYKEILVGAGARYPLFHGVNYNRSAGGGFTNNEPTTILRDNLDLQTQTIGPLDQGSITVGASPFTHTNTTGNTRWVSIFGGTISGLTITRGGVNNSIDASNKTVILAPGDAIAVTYSVAPLMYFYSL